jgi:hypothetical protein
LSPINPTRTRIKNEHRKKNNGGHRNIRDSIFTCQIANIARIPKRTANVVNIERSQYSLRNSHSDCNTLDKKIGNYQLEIVEEDF